MAVESGFDAAMHGFHFRNRFNGLDVLKEVDDGLGNVAGAIAGSAKFWDGFGLCGGMAWHALDRFYAKNPIPKTKSIPDGGSPLFRILVVRQMDSFHGTKLLGECVKWQSRSDKGRWFDPRASIRHLTLKQWPKLKDSIERGFPASLTLIRTTTSPWENHQVLAIAYEEDTIEGLGKVSLYDPNHPAKEPTITLELAGDDAGRAEQNTGEHLRGFFPRIRPPRPS